MASSLVSSGADPMRTKRAQCMQCGSSLASDETGFGVCMKCNTTAIAEPGSAPQAQVTASDPSDDVHIRSGYAPQPSLRSCADDESTTSILREYHYSFLRIFLYNLIWVAFLVLFFIFLAKAS